MPFHSDVGRCGCLLATLLVVPSPEFAPAHGASERPALIAAARDDEYRRKLEAYVAARQAYENQSKAYWMLIAEKRRARIAKRRSNQDIVISDYVLAQPPVYSGPPKPLDPSAPPEEAPPGKYVPVVADFLDSAEREFQFVPERPRSESEYKRAYAGAASAAGLTKDQVVRIYAFEAGGDGKYDVQAGLEQPTPGARAVSTALGYNQLLAANSVELLAEKGDNFIAVLRRKADGSTGEAKAALERKIAALVAMVDFCRTVPDEWSEHEKLASTPKGLGIHALNLDIDVGPLLQTQKLLDSVEFARTKGHVATLTAAELEMMNLSGDGNGFDILTMPPEWCDQVPTSNFFQQGGYERNPIVIRNNVVAKLLAATDAVMDREVGLLGAKELAGLLSR